MSIMFDMTRQWRVWGGPTIKIQSPKLDGCVNVIVLPDPPKREEVSRSES